MGDKKMSFRERNSVRLAKKKKAVASKVDCYESGERLKFLDFLIGFGIFFLAGLFSIIGLLIVGVLGLIYYDRYFNGRVYVKYGIISYFICLGILLLILSFFIYGGYYL